MFLSNIICVWHAENLASAAQKKFYCTFATLDLCCCCGSLSRAEKRTPLGIEKFNQ
jgi:hypothetical protein